MPYIKQSDRTKYEDFINQLASECIITGQPGQVNAGDLNYVITSLVTKILEMKGLNYANLNTVVGVLECLKLEFYRRLSEYENIKIKENGDVLSYERMLKTLRENQTLDPYKDINLQPKDLQPKDKYEWPRTGGFIPDPFENPWYIPPIF